MTRRLAIFAVFTALLVGTSVPARAQSIPEGQSCGGLLCDMGVFGHKTPPSAPPPPLAAPAATAPPPTAAEAVPPEPAEVKKRITRKTKRLAKAAPVAAPARAPVAAPSPPQPAAQAAPSILNPYAVPQTTMYRFKPIYQ